MDLNVYIGWRMSTEGTTFTNENSKIIYSSLDLKSWIVSFYDFFF